MNELNNADLQSIVITVDYNEKGDIPAHRWEGTSLQFENPNGSWGEEVDLKGEKGNPPAHQWDGTKLEFENPDGTPGQEVDLKGEQGEKGDIPAHEWDNTKLRFENPDGSWGAQVDLKTPTNGIVESGNTDGVNGNEVYNKTINGANKTAVEFYLAPSGNLIPANSSFQNRQLIISGNFSGSTSANFASIAFFDVSAHKGKYITLSGLGAVASTYARYVVKRTDGTVLISSVGAGSTNRNNVTFQLPNEDGILLAINISAESGSGTAIVNGTSPFFTSTMIAVGTSGGVYQPIGKAISLEKMGITQKFAKVIISPTGNDLFTGQTNTYAVQTFTRAKALMADGGTLIMLAGDYIAPADFELSMFDNIIAEPGARIIYGTMYTAATQTDGYTRVYQVARETAPGDHMWQLDIPDPETLIDTDKRQAQHRGRYYRMPHTRIYPAASIEEIELTVDKLMYYHSDGVLYFSKTTGSDLTVNPICYRTATVLRATNKNIVRISGLTILFRPVFFENLTGDINITVGCAANAGCIMYDNCRNLVFRDCETYGATNDGANGVGASNQVTNVTFINLYSHDNVDDGESCHQYVTASHFGGLIEFNGNGVTPASGGRTFLHGTIVQYNRNRSNGNPWANNEEGTGVSAQGAPIGSNPATTVTCMGVIAIGNQINFRGYSDGTAMFVNCVSKSPVTSHFLSAARKYNCVEL